MDVDIFLEIGTGKVLSNLNKRIDKDLKSISLEHPEDIENLLTKSMQVQFSLMQVHALMTEGNSV